MIESWKKINSTTLLNHTRLTVVEDTVILPSKKEVLYVKIINQPDSVTIICIDNGKILLQREYSYPVDKVMYQFPGGKINPDESVISAGLRELEEESGYAGSDYSYLGFYYPNNRRSASKMHVILVKSCVKVTEGTNDDEEFIESDWVSLDELMRLMKSQQIVNYSILAGWSLYQASL